MTTEEEAALMNGANEEPVDWFDALFPIGWEAKAGNAFWQPLVIA